MHNAALPFNFKEGGGKGEVPHYAHENECSTYLLFKSGPLIPKLFCLSNMHIKLIDRLGSKKPLHFREGNEC